MEAAVVGLSIDDSPSAAAPYTSLRHRGFGTLDNGEEHAHCGVCDGPKCRQAGGTREEKKEKSDPCQYLPCGMPSFCQHLARKGLS